MHWKSAMLRWHFWRLYKSPWANAVPHLFQMADETPLPPPPDAVREFAKSFQALINVVSPGVSGRVAEQTEEMKAGRVEHCGFFG